MESVDNEKLAREEENYRSWLRKEPFRQDQHVCFDIPPTKEGTDSFDFENKLMQAAIRGCNDCLVKLIKAGGDVNKTGKYKVTTLMWASRYGYPESVNLLLKAGADLYMTDEFGKNAISHAMNRSNTLPWETGQQRDCIDILLKIIGANVNSSPPGTDTPLMSVAAFGDNAWLKSLIQAGADLNTTDTFGRTALMKAIAAKHDDCTRTLLKAGADVNLIDKEKWTALTHAAATTNNDCILP